VLWRERRPKALRAPKNAVKPFSSPGSTRAYPESPSE
jgi:hypothetical protein